MQTLNEDALRRIAAGATFLGGGGGGTFRAGEKMIDRIAKRPKPIAFDLLEVEEIEDDGGLTVACGFLANQSQVEDETNIEDLSVALKAFQKEAESRKLGRIRRLVPIELGVQSSVVPVCLTAHLLNQTGWQLRVVDADGAGRAVPVLSATTFATATSKKEKGVSVFPAVFGGHIPDKKVPGGKVPGGRFSMLFEGEDSTAFHLHRAAVGSIVAFEDHSAALVCWPIGSKDALELALPKGVRGTLSLAHELGRILTPQGVKDVMPFLDNHDRKSFRLFQGTVREVSDNQQLITLQNGHNLITIVADGENLAVVDLDTRQVKAMAPDSICFVTDKGTPLSSAELDDLKKHHQREIVNVIGIEARREIVESPLVQLAFQIIRTTAAPLLNKAKTQPGETVPPKPIDLQNFIPLRELNPYAQSVRNPARK